MVAAATIDATDIGAKPPIEKRLRSASWANIIPAIGAPNPEDIAAAAPQAISTSFRMYLPLNFEMMVAKVAPK